MNRYMFLHRIKGPVIILVFGVTALLHTWHILSYSRSWPLYLIVIGLLQLAERFGLRVSRVSVRNQQSRWGSCSPNGHICLNWRLVTMPEWVRDYVIIHELMHLKRLDHSPKFWKLVAAACPEYQKARAWLRKCPQI